MDYSFVNIHMYKSRTVSVIASLGLSFVILFGLVFSPVALLPVRAQEATQETESTPPPAETTPPSNTVSDSPSDTPPADSQTPPASTDGTDGTAQEQATQHDSSAGDGGSGGDATGPAEITTGDALAESETSTTANINTIDTNIDTLGSGTSTPATSTPKQNTGGGSTATTITDNNTATSTTEGITTAETGDNQASASVGGGSGSGASIETGNAYASANVINAVNVNIVNSNAFFFLLSNFLRPLGDLDFRSLFSSFQMPSVSGCNTGCDATSGKLTTTVTNTNDAVVSNSTIVRADTGGNTATGTDAYIGTGDAYASANVLNLVNANFVDSQYLLVAFNNFGNWAGDFVLPTGDFFTSFFGGGGVSGDATVTNTNNATVNNNVTTDASTGGNTATGNDSLIVSGDAGSQSTVYNQVNSNLFGGSTLLVVFRIYGNWNGSVFNAPPGVLWTETPYGVELVYDPEAAATGSGAGANYSSLSVNNTNNATVNNDVQVYALTGDNKLHGSEIGTIETGDAYASSNVMNIVNTNTYSHNYILAFVNIFGDWGGSLSFGRPDLWLGMRAEAPSTLYAGNTLRYHFVVKNRGDANASHVRIKHVFDNPLVTFLNDHGAPTDPEWDIGDIPAGGSKEVTIEAKVSNNVPPNDTLVTGTATVTSTETDDDTGDNSDTITLSIQRNINSKDASGTRVDLTQDAKLHVTKTNDGVGPMSATSTVNYTVTVHNTGGPAYHASLVDELRNEQGKLISRNTWDLDTIKPNEEITVNYSVEFSPKALGGLYTNTAQVSAISGSPSLDPFYGRFTDSNVATSTVIIKPKPAVVGLTAPATDVASGSGPGISDGAAVAEAAAAKLSQITEAAKRSASGLVPPLKFFGPHLPDNVPLVFAPENNINESQLAAALPAPGTKDVFVVSLLLLALLAINAHRLGYLKQLPARVSGLQFPSTSVEILTRAYSALWLSGFSRRAREWWQAKKTAFLEWLRKQRDSWAESFASF